MEDLLDLKWTPPINEKPVVVHNYSAPAMKHLHTDTSRHAPRLPGTQSTKPVTPANDLFGGLVDFGSSLKKGSLTMEQQRVAMRQRKDEEHMKMEEHFGGLAFHDKTTADTLNPQPHTAKEPRLDHPSATYATEEDLLDAINSGNRNSYFAPPETLDRELSTQTFGRQSLGSGGEVHHHDQILGELSLPMNAPKPTRPSDAHPPPFTQSSSPSDSDSNGDVGPINERNMNTNNPCVAHIVDMGFTELQAINSLAKTDTGLDVAAALEYLLSVSHKSTLLPRSEIWSDSAHMSMADRKLANQTQIPEDLKSSSHIVPEFPIQSKSNVDSTNSTPSRRISMAHSVSGNSDWVDHTYVIASKTVSSANYWLSNTSALARRKFLELAVPPPVDVKDDRPKWLRDAERLEKREKGKGKARDIDQGDEAKEEGLPMHPAERKRLEANGVLPPSQEKRERSGSIESSRSGKNLTDSIRNLPENIRSFGSQKINPNPKQPSRTIMAEDDKPVYVSRNRRKQEIGTSQREASLQGSPRNSQRDRQNGILSQQKTEEEDDLYGSAASTLASPHTLKGMANGKRRMSPTLTATDNVLVGGTQRQAAFRGPRASHSEKASGPVVHENPTIANVAQVNTKLQPVMPRRGPSVSNAAMLSTHRARTQGSEALKRGDFVQALASYGAALQYLPPGQPLRVVLLSNRAYCYINLGDPKSAIIDCDTALDIIGSARGKGKHVDVEGKSICMEVMWVKLITRKANALEIQESYKQALDLWNLLVRSGLGGKGTVAARQRCQNTLTPRNPVTSVSAVPVINSDDQVNAAMARLRTDAASQASEEAERDLLYEPVQRRLDQWSKGKDANVRALLASLDTILWPSAGWKKVGLHDLVVDAKVKTVYVKALSKVHPDKISRSATVEEKMIAGGIFAKLNDAYNASFARNAG